MAYVMVLLMSRDSGHVAPQLVLPHPLRRTSSYVSHTNPLLTSCSFDLQVLYI
jgi:hypothetical protein